MTKTTVAAALAAILLSGPALSDSPDQIRAKLLATPVWIYEWKVPNAPPGKVNTGKAWFAEKDGKLIGYLDDGWKCDSEVTLRQDGFDMETCAAPDKRFVQSGDAFKATFGSYIYTIRPAP
jgi:hypothetical protein